ncbi:MAG: hypothetical protein II957_08695, partial [Treponema sp.]|nr:hypothetical protein [Treponema sp.]
ASHRIASHRLAIILPAEKSRAFFGLKNYFLSHTGAQMTVFTAVVCVLFLLISKGLQNIFLQE